MNKLASAIMLSALMSSTAYAAEMGAANPGTGEAMRGSPIGGYEFGRGMPSSPPKLEAGEESRAAPMMDETKIIEAFTALTRAADGTVSRSAPSDAMRGVVIEEMKGEAGKGANKIENSKDPALTEEEANRQVFGADDRVQIKNTKTYPFTTFGYIEGKSKKGYGGCSGTLIGPRTVLTAAHCLYSYDDKDWLTEVIFAPGLNGYDDAPFGAFAAESVSIVEGFVTNDQGFYGSVVPWDLGVITLAEPVGDTLGWLGYANYEGLGDFTANIVGYPGDKQPPALMWAASCEVSAENVSTENFAYDCDTYPGSSGSSVFAYDTGLKQRVVVGVNVAESPDANTAVRLNAAYVEWINSLWK